MISLDQVKLLEQKVESAVAKIQQLQAENDALRTKVTELTNAVSAKSEQLSSFESEQDQIESGIKKALDRLSSIENTVLKTAFSIDKNSQAASKPASQQTSTIVTYNNPAMQTIDDFDDQADFDSHSENGSASEEDSQDGLGFDIF
ncbi:cell division protein ZapB [Treponema sp. Marseille-Q3903]|uniref:cell division protein ZapB n=1 Tax=Treponema sp. Marseille-Q3903 TaxID=2766703 RepID=UPI0016526EDD|nr:cell division protein ZapB [Treponema sp. Marseille-Q3903]MBC6713944.1 cell division protein ZapB [Treponema sp. Marseille-Q3903]